MSPDWSNALSKSNTNIFGDSFLFRHNGMHEIAAVKGTKYYKNQPKNAQVCTVRIDGLLAF